MGCETLRPSPGALDSRSAPFRTNFISSLSLRVVIPKDFLLLQSLVPLSPNVLNRPMWKRLPLSFGRCQFTSVRDRLVFALHWQPSWTLKKQLCGCQLTCFQPSSCCLKSGVEFVNPWGLRAALHPPLFENTKCPGYELCEFLPLLMEPQQRMFCAG